MNVNSFGVEYLDLAGNMLERQDCRDSTLPGLLEVTGISQHGMATASGLNDYDYQNLSSLTLGHKQLNQITTVSKVPIPSEVLEHFKHIKCHCMMGLFPEIGRAWLTIDSEIYIWTYEQARDVAYYDGLNHLIISVGLIKPKAGVFIKDVKYLLILTTPTDIVVLGVTFGDTTKTISSPARNVQSTAIYEEMQLMNKPIFLLSSDNVAISTIKGSECGRIFLGGRDGCLYEIDYHAESSWFGKRCKKINHSQGILSYMVPNFLKVFSEIDSITQIVIDNSRNLLYTLSEKGSIEAWNMGQNCNEMQRIARLTQNDIAHYAGNVIKTVDISIFKPIKSLCPLTIDDCPSLHLIAVTQTGVRLFFSTINFNINYQQQNVNPIDIGKPSNLYLMHVRLPPGFTPNTTLNKPKQVHSAFYSEGTLLLISTPQQDQDLLWSISSTPFLNRPFLTESTTVLSLDGIVWSLAEIKDKRKSTLNTMQRNAQKPKKVALLTNQGAHIIALLQPADILQQLLIACHGPHHEAVKAFFQAQSEREACATSLVLACSDEYRGTDVSLWAAQAFMLYGGEPACHINTIMNPHRNLLGYTAGASNSMLQSDNRNAASQMIMSTPIQSRNTSLGSPFQMLSQSQAPPSPMTFSPHQTGNEFSNFIFSAKHDGLYLYVSRLLRPIWKKRCINQQFGSTVSQADCSTILDDLLAISRFLVENSVHEISGTLRNFNQNAVTNSFTQFNLPNSNMNDQRNSAEQAQNEEKKSLMALNYFIRHACEVLSLWKILCEHQFEALINQLTKEQQISLSSCSFRDLILNRTELCAYLIVTLINSYLSDNASVSSISSKLREVCPNLYRHEDAVSFKATEILMTSKTCQRNEEKDERLRTALQLCKDAAPNLPLSNICQQFILSKFYEGVVELCATCAAKIDPEEFALHYYRNNEPVEDREGYSAYASRMNYYKEVKQMLDIVYQNACNNNANNDIQQQTIANQNFNENSTTEIIKIVSLATQTNDPLLHVIVYEWLLAHDLVSELLVFGEPSLGEFLGRSVKRNPNNLKLTDLLWKYYEKNGQHAAAASILDNLASMQTNSVPLSQRIEYLARAVMCMRNDNVGCNMHNGVLLKDLEDKLEIARVQKVILDSIDSIITSEAKEASIKLNNCLYDMSQLYSDFAEPFNLWECKLTILNCSHHNEPLLIESVWSNILNNAIESNGLSAREKATRLLSKVHLLAKEFGESGHCFPLAFIIRELEIKCCRLRLDEGTVPEALIAMNLDLELLVDYYARMLSMNERVWANEGNESHLLKSTARLVSAIATNASQIPTRNRRRVIVKVQDLISACLNICYQKPGTDDLQQILKETQSRLQRIL